MKKAKIAAQYKLIAKLAAAEVKPKGWAPLDKAETAITFYSGTKRRRDADNALSSLKSAFDSLAAVGIISDDVGLRHTPIEFKTDKLKPRVEIVIRPL